MGKIKENLPFLIASIAALALLVFAYGCQPQTTSLIDPTEKVTRSELDWEIETLLAKSKIRLADLERQEELRSLLFEQTFIIAETGTVNPLGLITALMAIMGIGAGVDDVRLRKKQNKKQQE